MELFAIFFVRLNADASIDYSFSANSFPNQYVSAIAIEANGNIIIGGNFTLIYNWAYHIARFTAIGDPTNSFTVNNGLSGEVFTILIQPDGKIIAGGEFTHYNSIFTNKIIRFNSNGSIDPTFQIGTGFSSDVFSTAIQSDGKIIVGGNFNSYNGVTARGVTRLNGSGIFTNIEEKAGKLSPLVFPNPTDGKLSFENEYMIFQSITIQNLLGETILNLKENDISNKLIDVSSLTSGIYYMTIEANDEFSTIKFIKN